jgi:hypothetical protein
MLAIEKKCDNPKKMYKKLKFWRWENLWWMKKVVIENVNELFFKAYRQG